MKYSNSNKIQRTTNYLLVFFLNIVILYGIYLVPTDKLLLLLYIYKPKNTTSN